MTDDIEREEPQPEDPPEGGSSDDRDVYAYDVIPINEGAPK